MKDREIKDRVGGLALLRVSSHVAASPTLLKYSRSGKR